jgi:N-acetylmuramoyl-L-alanine amidase
MGSTPRRLLVALVGGVMVLAVALGVARARGRMWRRAVVRTPPRVEVHPASDPRRWPGSAATLAAVQAAFPPGFGKLKVIIDPGHGAPNNRGNLSSLCVDEQDAMLVLAEAVQTRLETTGHIEARLSRERGDETDYMTRAEDAAAWRADAFVSLHSDVRGTRDSWVPDAPSCTTANAGRDCGQTGHNVRRCPVALDAPGFTVLYSDEGDPKLAARRLKLGRALAHRMGEAGFTPYLGADYRPRYAADVEPGVFVDRHDDAQRIFVLRRLTMPTVLVETHNALDSREALRWEENGTIDAFAGALAAALADALAVSG